MATQAMSRLNSMSYPLLVRKLGIGSLPARESFRSS
jgi:hypothetical protein